MMNNIKKVTFFRTKRENSRIMRKYTHNQAVSILYLAYGAIVNKHIYN